MELGQDKFQLLKKGLNSKIYRYGDQQSGVVLKIVPTHCQKESKHLLNEYKILKKINHKNIINVLKYKEAVKINSVGQNLQQGTFNVLVMNQATMGNLLEFYKRNNLRLEEIKNLFFQICQGIQFLHKNYIAHRDIKLQNILLFQSQGNIEVKIADFGFASTVLEESKIKRFNCFKGTKRGYMAPQIHETLNNPTLTYEARKTDCFALGVVLFSLVLGKLPFNYGSKQNILYNLISQNKFQQFWAYHAKQIFELSNKDFSMIDEFKSLFQNIVCENPEKRYSLQNILQNPWLQNGKFQWLKTKNYK